MAALAEAAPVLLGREQECDRIDRLLDSSRSEVSDALVLRGEAGIGKSALLKHARSRATGMTVLGVTGNEIDAEISYAGLVDLLRPTMDAIDALPPAQRDTLRAAFASGAATPGSRFEVFAAVLGHLAGIASERPVLIVVDDAQWLDVPSAEAIAFVARRVVAEGIVVLVAERSDAADSHFGGLPSLSLAGLDEASVALLLAELDRAPADAAVYWRRTGGNPLAVRELAREALAASDDTPIRTTDAVQRVFQNQVRHLPERVREALVHVAAAGLDDMHLLPAVLQAAGLGVDDLEEAERAHLVTIAPGTVSFRHPLLRSAIYYDADRRLRRSAHLGFAAALDATDVPAAAERRVTHLALAADLSDESIAAELEAVGHAAAGRRSYAVATRMLERSALLSTDLARRAERYLAAATCALPAGRLTDLQRLVDAVLVSATNDTTRVAATQIALRGTLWRGLSGSVQRFLAGAVKDLETAPADAAVLLAELALVEARRGNRAGAIRHADRALAAAIGRPESIRMPALLVRAMMHATFQEHDPARRLLREALPWITSRPDEQWPLLVPTVHLLLDELDTAAAGIDLVVTTLRRSGAVDLLPVPLLVQSRVELRGGDWSTARVAAYEAASLVVSMGGSRSEVGSMLEPECAAAMAELEALTGDAEACRRHAHASLSFGTERRIDLMIGTSRRALGLLALGTGEIEAAALQFRALDVMASEYDMPDTPMLPWLSDRK
jgi:tetratricopeptide (TPR) repeat protein